MDRLQASVLAAEALNHGHEFVDRRFAIAGADRGADAAFGVIRQQLQGERKLQPAWEARYAPGRAWRTSSPAAAD